MLDPARIDTGVTERGISCSERLVSQVREPGFPVYDALTVGNGESGIIEV